MTTFNHSVFVPVVYRKVAQVIKKVQEDGIGLKASIYGNSEYDRNKVRVLSLATKILEKTAILEHILRTTQILIKEPRLNPWIARVLIHELLWRKELHYESKPVITINSYKNEIREALSTYKEDPDSLKPTEEVVKPRYARVNTFKNSVANVIAELQEQGMYFLDTVYETYNEYLESLAVLSHNCFMIDFHIKELLVFHSEFPFIRMKLYKNGTLILQDKSSCLAPFLLDPAPGSVVLDMCAAPGMKTNQLANLVGENGKVYAVERNQTRYLILNKLMKHHGMKNVIAMHDDSLRITGDKIPDVEYISVDPSCSGSGIVGRVEFKNSESDRLGSISRFQHGILCQGLKNFPNVKRVAYSTCSINPEENESVVQNALRCCPNYRLVNLQEKMKPNWNHFGSDKFGEIGTSCLYTNPAKDFTNGFFVAIFEKIKNKKRKHMKSEKNEETETNEQQNENEQEESDRKKKRKMKQKEINDMLEELDSFYERSEKELLVEVETKKKHKKKRSEDTIEENEEQKTNEQQNGNDHVESDKKKKRKKKQKNIDNLGEEMNGLDEINEKEDTIVDSVVEVETKKKHKRKSSEVIIEESTPIEEEKKSKSKKKKIKDKDIQETTEVFAKELV